MNNNGKTNIIKNKHNNVKVSPHIVMLVLLSINGRNDQTHWLMLLQYH